jgi:D-serine deaminase-like pyridoxal phosphate-dependent protein
VIRAGDAARQLYELLNRLPGVRPAGLHVYDGHNHQRDPAERHAAVASFLDDVQDLRDILEKVGLPVPRIVFGGTPTFPVYAAMDTEGLECSPGTCVLNDANYRAWFADLPEFEWGALLVTRVISRPSAQRVTLDLGYKAVASDPPAGQRCLLLDMPDAKAVLHNEEHLVVETPAAERFQPGDVVYAVPAHVCPTTALHQFAHVVKGGQAVARWAISARDRVLMV